MSTLTLKAISGDEVLPVIDIPEEAWEMDRPFSIQTKAGRLKVEMSWYCHGLVVTGSVEALTAYGLYRPAWAPNPEALTNKTTQAVLFTPDGVKLVVGKFQRSWNIDDCPYLVVSRVGTKFNIRVPFTVEQEERFDAESQKKQEARESREDIGQGSVNDPRPFAERAETYCSVLAYNAGSEIDKMKATLPGSYGDAVFSKTSEARILSAMNELYRAFVEARMVPLVPKYEQRGNVIGWPGRGRVQAVSPNMGRATA